MPGLVADSLPDKFGNAVIEQWLMSLGKSLSDFTAIDRLFIKNIFIKDFIAMTLIGLCLLIFSLILLILKKTNRPVDTLRFVTSISLTVLVFLISQFSGESFSDDFLLHLAVVALTGLYLRPKYTKIQVILSTLALLVQFFINPQKAMFPKKIRLL